MLKLLKKIWRQVILVAQKPDTHFYMYIVFIVVIATYFILKPLGIHLHHNVLIISLLVFSLALCILIIHSYQILTHHFLSYTQLFNFDNAYPQLWYDLYANINSNGQTYFQIISTSGYDEWEIIHDAIFSKGSGIGLSGNLHIEFILTDPHFLHKESHTQASEDALKVIKQMNKENKLLREHPSRITLSLHQVHFLPPFHGILLSGRVLYTGPNDWFDNSGKQFRTLEEHKKNERTPLLGAKTTDYRRYEARKNQVAKMKIENFMCWFENFKRLSIHQAETIPGNAPSGTEPPHQSKPDSPVDTENTPEASTHEQSEMEPDTE